MKKLLAILILSLIFLGGCYRGVSPEEILAEQKEKKKRYIELLKDSSQWFYESRTKKCYYIIFFWRHLGLDEVECEEVFNLLINREEYMSALEEEVRIQ